MNTRTARRIREGIEAGRAQARFERMYSRGGLRRFSVPGNLNAHEAAPLNFPGYVAFWQTLGRHPRDRSPLLTRRPRRTASEPHIIIVPAGHAAYIYPVPEEPQDNPEA